MISQKEEEYILNKAYVPEHIISLMSLISGGEPFLISDHLFFVKDALLMFIGYPLHKDFDKEECARLLEETVKKFSLKHIRVIAPSVPESCRAIESDKYYRLDIDNSAINKNLERVCERASRALWVEQVHEITIHHKELISEFIARVKPRSRVVELYKSLEYYMSVSKTACILNAQDEHGNLSAFYVVDEAAKKFATYLIGCHSRENYVTHASDLLMREMIRMARDQGKEYVHLGLGVNPGIRRFKEKWRGYPFLDYAYGEIDVGGGVKDGIMDYLGSKL